MRKLMFTLMVVITMSAVSAAFAAENGDWHLALAGKWSGVPDGISDRMARVLTITAIHEDGRVEGTFWGPTLGPADGLPLSSKSKAILSKNEKSVQLDLKTEVGGLDVTLDLTYNVKRGTLSGDYFPRPGWKAYTYFRREK